MNEICNKCGLPKELCVCEDIAKESQRITIKNEKRKFGKMYTIVEGIDAREIDMKELLKKLKNRLSCGGSFKEGKIELQGNHMPKAGKPNDVRKVLVESGFAPETIITKKR